MPEFQVGFSGVFGPSISGRQHPDFRHPIFAPSEPRREPLKIEAWTPPVSTLFFLLAIFQVLPLGQKLDFGKTDPKRTKNGSYPQEKKRSSFS